MTNGQCKVNGQNSLCLESVSQCFFIKFTVQLYVGSVHAFLSQPSFHLSAIRPWYLCDYQFKECNFFQSLCINQHWQKTDIFTTWTTEFCCSSLWMKECHLNILLLIVSFHDAA